MKGLSKIFSFNRSDRRAIIVLCCIAIIALIILIVVDAVQGQKKYEVKAAIDDSIKRERILKKEKAVIPLHEFDPNTVDSLTLIRFGLYEWKVKNFIHYRNAGKVFRSADDLEDTYGWTKADVERLRPYVKITTTANDRKDGVKHRQYERARNHYNQFKDDSRCTKAESGGESSYKSTKFSSLTPIDVNLADSSLLCRIPGIGAGISKSIISYRDRLGGFVDVNQLLEIKIFSPELKEWFYVSENVKPMRAIDVNNSSFQSLNAHPYISYSQTKSLLNYIRLYGAIDSFEELRGTAIFTEEELSRVAPYLQFVPIKK